MKSDEVSTETALVIATKPPRRVLVVDDHTPTLTAISALLERERPDIDLIGVASNGEVALQLLRTASPDVVVLDLELGDEYGLDLMPVIKRYPSIVVIILTSSDDPRERSRALAAGADDFISKFSPVGELISSILATQPRSI